ncbi:MAG: hypothetical protein ACPGGK_09155 [Pikeienuella sp.]
MPVASKILSTVNAPYGANLSACQLAACISDMSEMEKAFGPTFSFFTEIGAEHQFAFLEEVGVSKAAVKPVAQYFASKVPYSIALAA